MFTVNTGSSEEVFTGNMTTSEEVFTGNTGSNEEVFTRNMITTEEVFTKNMTTCIRVISTLSEHNVTPHYLVNRASPAEVTLFTRTGAYRGTRAREARDCTRLRDCTSVRVRPRSHTMGSLPLPPSPLPPPRSPVL